MYWVNKIIWALMNPMTIIWAMIAIGLVRRHGKWWKVLLGCGLVAMWIWMTPLMTRILGVPLEHEWLVEGKVPAVESFPEADAIVLLGGGMGGKTNVSAYAEMNLSADRVWQAARLWKREGRFEKFDRFDRFEKSDRDCVKILVTGEGNERTTKGLLMDFGVPTNAMVFVDARNTEEEAKVIARMFECPEGSNKAKPKVLLVTSAWHMKRAKLIFEKYAPEVEVVPAPADFEATTFCAECFRWRELWPSGDTLQMNNWYFHEWLGYWGYLYLR